MTSETKPSAFEDSPEDLIVKTDAWLEEVANTGTPVSAARVFANVKPLLTLLRRERQARSTSAELLRGQNIDIGRLSKELDDTVALLKARTEDARRASAMLARPSARLGLWLGRILSFFVFWRPRAS